MVADYCSEETDTVHDKTILKWSFQGKKIRYYKDLRNAISFPQDYAILFHKKNILKSISFWYSNFSEH